VAKETCRQLAAISYRLIAILMPSGAIEVTLGLNWDKSGRLREISLAPDMCNLYSTRSL
jgi:hypothetical protein